jgi:hypothetical protein
MALSRKQFWGASALIALVFAGYGVYTLIPDSEGSSNPPALELGGDSKFQGLISKDQACSGLRSLGVDKTSQAAIDDWSAPGAASADIQTGDRFYHAPEDKTVSEIFASIEPVANNRVLFAYYDPTIDGENTFKLYPALQGYPYNVDDPDSDVVPANSGFALISCEDTHFHNGIKSYEEASVGLSGLIGSLENNWINTAIPEGFFDDNGNEQFHRDQIFEEAISIWMIGPDGSFGTLEDPSFSNFTVDAKAGNYDSMRAHAAQGSIMWLEFEDTFELGGDVVPDPYAEHPQVTVVFENPIAEGDLVYKKDSDTVYVVVADNDGGLRWAKQHADDADDYINIGGEEATSLNDAANYTGDDHIYRVNEEFEAASELRITNFSASSYSFNPADAHTEITFEINEPARIVFLIITDPQGEIVVELLDEELDAGQHSVIWYGTSDGLENGEAVDPGEYYYGIQAFSLETEEYIHSASEDITIVGPADAAPDYSRSLAVDPALITALAVAPYNVQLVVGDIVTAHINDDWDNTQLQILESEDGSLRWLMVRFGNMALAEPLIIADHAIYDNEDFAAFNDVAFYSDGTLTIEGKAIAPDYSAAPEVTVDLSAYGVTLEAGDIVTINVPGEELHGIQLTVLASRDGSLRWFWQTDPDTGRALDQPQMLDDGDSNNVEALNDAQYYADGSLVITNKAIEAVDDGPYAAYPDVAEAVRGGDLNFVVGSRVAQYNPNLEEFTGVEYEVLEGWKWGKFGGCSGDEEPCNRMADSLVELLNDPTRHGDDQLFRIAPEGDDPHADEFDPFADYPEVDRAVATAVGLEEGDVVLSDINFKYEVVSSPDGTLRWAWIGTGQEDFDESRPADPSTTEFGLNVQAQYDSGTFRIEGEEPPDYSSAAAVDPVLNATLHSNFGFRLEAGDVVTMMSDGGRIELIVTDVEGTLRWLITYGDGEVQNPPVAVEAGDHGVNGNFGAELNNIDNYINGSLVVTGHEIAANAVAPAVRDVEGMAIGSVYQLQGQKKKFVVFQDWTWGVARNRPVDEAVALDDADLLADLSDPRNFGEDEMFIYRPDIYAGYHTAEGVDAIGLAVGSAVLSKNSNKYYYIVGNDNGSTYWATTARATTVYVPKANRSLDDMSPATEHERNALNELERYRGDDPYFRIQKRLAIYISNGSVISRLIDHAELRTALGADNPDSDDSPVSGNLTIAESSAVQATKKEEVIEYMVEQDYPRANSGTYANIVVVIRNSGV